MRILVEGIANNRNLVSLNLSHNQLTGVGAKTIAECLSDKNKQQSIKKLHLNANMISDEGAKTLAKMISTNNTILELHLNNNDISNKGKRI